MMMDGSTKHRIMHRGFRHGFIIIYMAEMNEDDNDLRGMPTETVYIGETEETEHIAETSDKKKKVPKSRRAGAGALFASNVSEQYQGTSGSKSVSQQQPPPQEKPLEKKPEYVSIFKKNTVDGKKHMGTSTKTSK